MSDLDTDNENAELILSLPSNKYKKSTKDPQIVQKDHTNEYKDTVNDPQMVQKDHINEYIVKDTNKESKLSSEIHSSNHNLSNIQSSPLALETKQGRRYSSFKGQIPRGERVYESQATQFFACCGLSTPQHLKPLTNQIPLYHDRLMKLRPKIKSLFETLSNGSDLLTPEKWASFVSEYKCGLEHYKINSSIDFESFFYRPPTNEKEYLRIKGLISRHSFDEKIES